MTWHPDHPGGVITCDRHGCTRERRHHCTPTERDQWQAIHPADGRPVIDLCPDHRTDEPEEDQ